MPKPSSFSVDFTIAPGLASAPGLRVAAQNLQHGPAEAAVHADVFEWVFSPDAVGDVLGDFAGAKPSHAGRGKTTDSGDTGDGATTDSSTGDGGKGGGKGKNKTQNTDTETTTDTTTDTTTTTPTDTTTSTDNTAETNTSSYVTADFTSGLDTPDDFNISVLYSGTWSDGLTSAFEAALELISDFVTADVSDTETSYGMVDDILITASVGTIDGSGNYIGWGSVNQIRTSGDMTASVGSIMLDEADMSSFAGASYFQDFIVHEVLHAMGFGTLWSYSGLVEDVNGQLRFTGQNAIDAYNSEFADIAAADEDSWYGVPVEMEGGPGTAGVHWDDTTFNDEVMTGRLNWTNVISDMTLASLEDMGYQTTYGDDLLVA